MMWIVILALRRPYTFTCVSVLILIFGVFSILRMAVDIFPVINLPVATVVWYYTGMGPEEMERRITTSTERFYSSVVNDIEHIESSSFNGVAVIKIYFQPGADVASGVAQITAASQSFLKQLPTGATPPTIQRFNATDAPIMYLAISGKSMPEDVLNDIGNNFVRTPLATLRGAAIGPSLGGKPRNVMVDIDLKALYAAGLSPSDVSAALGGQNVILPSGTVKMGGREYNVRLNASPDSVSDLNNIPLKQVNGTTVYMRDVAQVRQGPGVQVNIVRLNGRRGLVIPIFKTGGASTLSVIAAVEGMLPQLLTTLPEEMSLKPLADQSIFVKGAIRGVITEALIAACLTALMILLFLGSWRSTLIVATSIPLAVLTSIICLYALGQTLNQMTLGGLALAVGILVDDATVEIENINRNIHMGKEVLQAIVDAASQTATPTFVASLSISIVFIPIFLLAGPAAALFRPLALAVVFAVLASYLLSRTIVPTMARYLLAHEAHVLAEIRARIGHTLHESDTVDALEGASWFKQIHLTFDSGFERFRLAYLAFLAWTTSNRRAVLIGAGVFVVGSFLLIPLIGEDFFPRVDGGQFQIHVRAPTGTQVEETESLTRDVENAVREVIPADEVDLVFSNIGLLNNSSTWLATVASATVGPQDADILVTLNEHHHSTWDYVRRLRARLPKEFPGVSFSFEPADLVSHVLNLGLPSRIDVQVQGQKKAENYQVARALAAQIAKVPGAVDVRVQQAMDYPEMFFTVDRDRASELGLQEKDVANQLTISLSSSGQTSPNYWLDPRNGINYSVQVMTPQYKVSNMEDLATTPVAAAGQSTPQLFGNLASGNRQLAMAVVNHYNIMPVMDVMASNDQRDLGGVARDIDKIVEKARPTLPRGSQIVVRGQVQSMRSSFTGIGVGIIGAVVLAYILMVVNFQSWASPFVIVLGLPGALAGIIWMLYATNTTFNVPSLMGAIMAVGVATSNSILLVVFAEEQRDNGRDAHQAILDAGYTRLRPVCMTALAMIIGMLPMALGLGDGGEQNAPLGRAVIGGLLAATFFTLLVVPVLYTIVRAGPAPQEIDIPAVSVS
jgi:multidrug efflux pump subunit AcrB